MLQNNSVETVMEREDERSSIQSISENGRKIAVVKTFTGQDNAFRCENEWFAHKYCEATGALRTPPLLDRGENTLKIGYVEGTPSKDHERVLQEIARFHAISRGEYWQEVQQLFLNIKPPYRDRNIFFSALEEAVTAAPLAVSMKALMCFAPERDDAFVSLTHGDFHPPHIIKDAEGAQWYIDLELAGRDTVFADAASYLIAVGDYDHLAATYLYHLEKEGRKYGRHVPPRNLDMLKSETVFRSCQGHILVTNSDKPKDFKRKVKERVSNALQWALEG